MVDRLFECQVTKELQTVRPRLYSWPRVWSDVLVSRVSKEKCLDKSTKEFQTVRPRFFSWPQVSSDMLVSKEKCLDKSEEFLTDPWGWHGSSESLSSELQEVNIPGVSLERQADDLEDFLQIRQMPLLQKGHIHQLLQELNGQTEIKAQDNLYNANEFPTDSSRLHGSSKSSWWKVLTDSDDSSEDNVEHVDEANEFPTDSSRLHGSSKSSWWKVLTDSDDSSEDNVEHVDEANEFPTDSSRLHGSSKSSWWKVLTDSDDSSEDNVEHVDEVDLQMIPSILHIKPHELSDMGVREIKNYHLDEDSSWGEESTDSEFGSDSKEEHLDKYFSKQKYPHTSYSRHHAVHRLTINQNALERLRSHLCIYNPPKNCVDCINILLFGMMGAGKSSTINTFLSALDPDGRTINCVPTGQHPDSLTLELKSYKSNSLKFWDTTGWNSFDDAVKAKEVLRMILEGRVPPGTNLKDFNPDSDDAQNPVILKNVIHGVAFVFNTFTIDNVGLDLLKQLQDLHTFVAQKNIYKIVIGTNFDRLRIPKKSYDRIYANQKLKRKFAKLSDHTGMKKCTMFVVSNEWKGDKIEKTKCVLALYALKNMVKNILKA
ncbi:uncharacterized protein LOC121270969 isoform X2 [Carcharodon carcharias]|uniref:uncharacterized protein LOC121270969 isoform X2 n=1 Tax=Carcharodon carcharias TaxID=13397 RepID=UPI001B7DDA2F|nr:uncharacterized protein LOC121270969 isoform X2 [Carcharodon carcharias]